MNPAHEPSPSARQRRRRLAFGLMIWLSALLASPHAHAQDASTNQPNRFLLVFETSTVMKKNLPTTKGILDDMFSGNIQNEMRTDDDLAVWTVDQSLHTGTFGMTSWSPDDAETYSANLSDFLSHEKYSRKASLAALQPTLNRVVKSSDRLTVIIFCDGNSRLSGTPYDDGINQIITNATSRLHGEPTPFVVVLRAYQGTYLGCSVNRSLPLNIPKFPKPPAPKSTGPQSVVVSTTPPPTPSLTPSTPPSGPVVTPVPALIIVGTNATTNAADALKPAESGKITTPPPANPAPPTASPPTSTATVKTPPPPESAPAMPPPQMTPAVTTPPPPAAATVPPTPTEPISPAQTSSVAPAPETAATPMTNGVTEPATDTNRLTATATDQSPDKSLRGGLIAGGAALLLAVVIVSWLALRGRRPQGSLITSSMHDDPRLPPGSRK
jgi:hypothetical protein